MWGSSLSTLRPVAVEAELLSVGTGKEGGLDILAGERDTPELPQTRNERRGVARNRPHTSPIWHHSWPSLSSTLTSTREELMSLSLLARN
jgi:hypothetical protein